MVQKKYVDIERLKDKYAEAFKLGEHIVCQEKVDGANAAIAYNPETNTLVAFSRRQELTPFNTLQGFYEFVQSLNPNKWKEATNNGRYIIFGEWLIKHTISYPEDKMKQFYSFDIWDTKTEQYLPWSITRPTLQKLGLNIVPTFYNGAFISWEHIYSLVGKTEMDASPCGEGVVIKSQDRLDNKSSRTPAYVKIVSKEFSEVHQSKPQKEIDPEKLAARQAAEALAETIITERRIQKILQKFVEDNIIPADWDEKNLGQIAKILPKAAYEDCVKEEPETVAQIENFGKICAAIAMKHARGLVK